MLNIKKRVHVYAYHGQIGTDLAYDITQNDAKAVRRYE